MDSDRKSTVSSFYGGRKGSFDALNNDFPNNQRNRADSSSSFYNGGADNRQSVAAFGGRTAGYNTDSYFHAGRQEPLKGGRDEEEMLAPHADNEPWDVYADFNNAGPRYSTAFGKGDEAHYQQLPPGAGSPLTAKFDDTASAAGGGNGVEMVTVPAMGAEWGKAEMKAMTKAGRKEKKAEGRRAKFRRWIRDEEGLCGVNWMTRRTLVFILFGLCAVVGVALAFTIPRVPSFAFNSDHPLTAATGDFNKTITTFFSRSPTNFTFPAFASLQLNTQSNYLPIHFNHLRASIFDLQTDRQVAHGDLSTTVPAKGFPLVDLPLNFTYTAINASDQTWVNWHDACVNKVAAVGGSRPPLKFRLVLDMDIRGLPGKHLTSAEVSDADCPFELPLSSG